MDILLHQGVPFFIHHWPLFVSLVLLLIVILVFELQAKAKGPAIIDPSTAVEWMNHQSAIVIDIRDKEAFRKGHIIHSQSIEPAHVVSTVTDEKQAEKYRDKPILLVCAQGVSAQKTAVLLQKEGIEKVAVLKGGIQAWTAADLPLEKNK